ncbi:MAG: hypothetical protein GY862_25100 [Gammaproteobacteria bacterium]|nr:hypothetical protein [Gammaproteobacteria bacterium]
MEEETSVKQKTAQEPVPPKKSSATRRRHSPQTSRPASQPSPQAPQVYPVTSEELQLDKEPLKVRETGFWRWKQVIVPPSAYVVHTRIGRDEPVTIGLGKSFRYNPYTDAYLAVPGAMQTIGIVARSITKEKQGINILAYVQWEIADLSIAYKKLDFADSREDPLGIVNAQLSEQAEAAIKDKIATMSVEEVLTDKAPIIEELTKRLEAVTEGRSHDAGASGEGLGIKIVTVQIREVFVSSQRLWKDLQAPFRHQQERTARISLLAIQNEVYEKEQESVQQQILLKEQTAETKLASEQKLQAQQARLVHEKDLEALQQAHTRILERTKLESEAANDRKTLETEQSLHAVAEDNRLGEARTRAEQQRLEQETELKKQAAMSRLIVQEQEEQAEVKAQEAQLARQRQACQARLERKEAKNKLKTALQEKEIEHLGMMQAVRNSISEADLRRRLIDKSSEIAAEMPDIHELKVLQTGSGDAGFDVFSSFAAKLLALAENLGISLKPPQAAPLPEQPARPENDDDNQ